MFGYPVSNSQSPVQTVYIIWANCNALNIGWNGLPISRTMAVNSSYEELRYRTEKNGPGWLEIKGAQFKNTQPLLSPTGPPRPIIKRRRTSDGSGHPAFFPKPGYIIQMIQPDANEKLPCLTVS